MNKNSVKYVFFDFDNTLVDSLKFWNKIKYRDIPKIYSKKVDKKTREMLDLLGNKDYINSLKEIYKIDDSFEQIKANINNKILTLYTSKIKLIKNVKNFLEYLALKNYKIVLASATDIEVLNVALKHFGIDKHFSYIFTEDNTGYQKPQPQFFEYCMKKLEAKPKDIFFFEDSVSSILSARKNDIKVCGIIHHFNKKLLKKYKDSCELIIKNYADQRLKVIL